MVTISCSGKFHAFALAEQLEKRGLLDKFYTTYAFQKNRLLSKFVRRVDKEQIPPGKIYTNTVLAFPIKLLPKSVFTWNDYFDRWVATAIPDSKSSVFIGWSGMSLHSIMAAKKVGIHTILERGSSHIVYQDEILKEEYRNFGKTFSIDQRVIDKELKEYEAADYISVPSHFVRSSFLEKGISADKLIMNPYGAGMSFQVDPRNQVGREGKFTLVYMGSLIIRKGLVYLFEAISKLRIPESEFNVWFIGSVSPELEPIIAKYKKSNWTFFGHIDHYTLKEYLSKCHVGIQPSLEEGLSMVIPQMMASGVAMIVTPNTGGGNIIKDGCNGYIVPIRSSQAIADKIEMLFHESEKRNEISSNAVASISGGFTWNDYGERYAQNLEDVRNG